MAPVVTVPEHNVYIINSDSEVNCVWMFVTLLARVEGVFGDTEKGKAENEKAVSMLYNSCTCCGKML